MFGSWVLNEIWIIDLSSALVGMLMSLTKLFPFFRCETVIGIVPRCNHRACCLFYCLREINGGINSFTFTLLNLYTSISGCGCGFGFEQKFWGIDGLREKKGIDRRIYIPLFTPL